MVTARISQTSILQVFIPNFVLFMMFKNHVKHTVPIDKMKRVWRMEGKRDEPKSPGKKKLWKAIGNTILLVG